MADVDLMEVAAPHISKSISETKSGMESLSIEEGDVSSSAAKDDESEVEDPLVMQTSIEETVRLEANTDQKHVNEEVKNGDHVERNGVHRSHDQDTSNSEVNMLTNGDESESLPGRKQLPSTSFSGLVDIGNKIKTETIPVISTPKKSNLKRSTSVLTPDSDQMTPSKKRIRIVENLDAVNSNNHIKLEDEVIKGLDDSANVLQVETCEEVVTWISSSSPSRVVPSIVNVEYVRSSLIPVKRKFSVEIDMRFILTETMNGIIAQKNSVNTLGPSDFHLWIVQNSLHNCSKLKVAHKENFVKLANLDAILNYDLTSPKELMLERNEADAEKADVYFVGDLYQKSKGFREYILWKTSQQQKHFSTKVLTIKNLGPCVTESEIENKTGLLIHPRTESSSKSLKDEEDLLAHLPTEMVEEFQKDGLEALNILDARVIDDFVEFVHSRTGGKGLHLFVADSSEVSYVYESCREVRFQKYFYCKCLLALRCIRKGGTFICKIFDNITLFVNGLIFLMYKSFEKITILKPYSSSPYTAERFLICTGKIENQDSNYVIDFLTDCLDMVVNNQEKRKIIRGRAKRLLIQKFQVQALVPLTTILADAEFFQLIRRNSIQLGTQLVESIEKLCLLMRNDDKTQLNDLAASLRKTYASKLSLWNISPELPNFKADPLDDPVEECHKFLSSNGIFNELSSVKEIKLETIDALLELQSSNRDKSFIAVPIQGIRKSVFQSVHGFFFGCGQSQIAHLDSKTNSWGLIQLPEVSLPRGTLVIGEVAEEVHQNKFIRCFHLFDAIYLYGVYIGCYPIEQRQKMLSRFASCMRNRTRKLNENINIVSLLKLNELNSFYRRTFEQNLIGYKDNNLRCYRSDEIFEKNFALVRGFMIQRNIQDICPSEFLKKYQQFVWYWDKSQTNLETDLEKLTEK